MDKREFETKALEHLDGLYRMAMQLTRHPDEAADLVQEAYLKALRVSDRYEERGGGMRPWLFKVLHNAFYSRMTRARKGPINVDNFHGEAHDGPEPDEARPAWDLASFDWDQVDEDLKAAIEDLNPEYREVLLLWGVEGMKYREIALVLEVPIGTVMSRLHRARSVLVKRLAPKAGELGVRTDRGGGTTGDAGDT